MRLLKYLILLCFVVFALTPIFVMISNSLKTLTEIGENPLGVPRRIDFTNYPTAWVQGKFAVTMRNSLILCIGTVLGVLILGGFAAFSLAKLPLPKYVPGILLVYFLVVSTLPIQLFLVPLFILWRRLGLINTHIGVIIIYIATNAPFSIFLLRSYLLGMPVAFLDAARIEGANELSIYFKIIIPVSWPIFLTVGLIVATNVWNEFIIATTFLQKENVFTVVTSYYAFQARYGSVEWNLTSAAGIMMMLPVVTLFLLLQRRFIQGLTQGAIKG